MRYFLLDKITEHVPGELARGVKCVTLTDETLHDHFPDFPVLPGALLVEAAAQLAGYLLEADAGPKPPRALLVQIEKVKFYRPARPGDRVEITAKLESRLDAAAQVACEATVDGERVMRGRLTFMLKAIDSEKVHAQREYLYKLWTS